MDVAGLSLVVPLRDLSQAPEVAARLPGGWREAVFDGSVGLRRARNHGGVVAEGSILLHLDDDVLVEATEEGVDLSWFSTRPQREVWWSAARYVNATEDEFTTYACTVLNVGIRLRTFFAASLGCFQPMRREAFLSMRGYDEKAPSFDIAMAMALNRRYGPPHPSPFQVTILRRISNLDENQERYLRELDMEPRNGPALRLLPKLIAV